MILPTIHTAQIHMVADLAREQFELVLGLEVQSNGVRSAKQNKQRTAYSSCCMWQAPYLRTP